MYSQEACNFYLCVSFVVPTVEITTHTIKFVIVKSVLDLGVKAQVQE